MSDITAHKRLNVLLFEQTGALIEHKRRLHATHKDIKEDLTAYVIGEGFKVVINNHVISKGALASEINMKIISDWLHPFEAKDFISVELLIDILLDNECLNFELKIEGKAGYFALTSEGKKDSEDFVAAALGKAFSAAVVDL